MKTKAQFDKIRHIEISKPLGAGNSFHVMINKYYNGDITKNANYGWQIHLHPTTILREMMLQL
jgi:hypothetical protein